VHPGDAPGEVEIGLDAVDRGIVGSGDEDRVGSAAALARRLRERVAEAGERLAAEGQVDVVEAQRVEPADLREDARRLGHQLRADAVAGQASHRPGPTTHDLAPDSAAGALLLVI
jgi:hypothetical protein